jgi:hypothetical protein
MATALHGIAVHELSGGGCRRGASGETAFGLTGRLNTGAKPRPDQISEH